MFGGWLSSGLLQTLNLAEARVLQGIYWSLLKEPTHQSSDALFGFKALSVLLPSTLRFFLGSSIARVNFSAVLSMAALGWIFKFDFLILRHYSIPPTSNKPRLRTDSNCAL